MQALFELLSIVLFKALCILKTVFYGYYSISFCHSTTMLLFFNLSMEAKPITAEIAKHIATETEIPQLPKNIWNWFCASSFESQRKLTENSQMISIKEVLGKSFFKCLLISCHIFPFIERRRNSFARRRHYRAVARKSLWLRQCPWKTYDRGNLSMVEFSS